MSSIGVLGAGTWGMALARMLSNSGHDVTVWSAIEKEVEDAVDNKGLSELIDATKKFGDERQKKA